MNKWVRFFVILTLAAAAAGCSEMIPKDRIFPVAKNSVIVLDQNNKSVLSMNTADNSVNILGTLATTTLNDIKIKGDFAYVVISSPPYSPSEGNKLVRYDLTTGDTSVLSFAEGSNPNTQVIDGGKIYLTLSKSNQVAVIDIGSFTVDALVTLSPAGAPYGIASDSNNIYVATSIGYIDWTDPGNYTNSRITVIAKSNLSQVTNISCVRNPVSLTICGQILYIAGASVYDTTGKVQGLDLASYVVTDIAEIPLCAPANIKSHDGKLYVVDGTYGGTGGLYIYDTTTKNLDYILSNTGLQGVDFDGTSLYVTETFLGTKTYKVNLSNLAMETINGIGGGDCAIYR